MAESLALLLKSVTAGTALTTHCMFDVQQPAYVRLREIHVEKTRQLVAWTGAGLSLPAKLPTWVGLRDRLLEVGEKGIIHQDPSRQGWTVAHLALAKNESNLWEAFGHLHKALGETTFTAEVKQQFSHASTATIPPVYLALWKLSFHGMINLNIDGLAARAFAEVKTGKQRLVEFSSKHAKGFSDAVLNGGNPFIMNLHGVIDDETSWVLVGKALDELLKAESVKRLVENIAQTRAIVFAGISADDIAAGGYLERLRSQGVNFANHFWITHRNDTKTINWAERAGIRIIFYRAVANDHSELAEALRLLPQFVSKDDTPPPIIPHVPAGLVPLDSPEVLETKSPEVIRKQLSVEAARILGENSNTSSADYSKFCSKYADAIWKAWSINSSEKNRCLFGYEIQNERAKGAFGRVYTALSAKGRKVAIKVLHANVREDPKMLECFRRGVRAMKILHGANVKGMVPYENAWEIPACAVMEFIEGPNLEEAVEHNYLNNWEQIIEVATELSRILSEAHLHPQRVLHRDVRPANIMLKDYDSKPTELKVVVLDFDLSWHRDAIGHSIDWSQSVSGFTPPELASADGKEATRSALIDSFGIGMTLYFLATKVKPSFLQHKHEDWRKTLRERVINKDCPRWRSLPIRFARLVEVSTREKQSERWDMTRIHGELSRLKKCVNLPSSIDAAELLAEELAASCPSIANTYHWNTDRSEATASLETSQAEIVLFGNESSHRVELRISWTSQGLDAPGHIIKYAKKAHDQAYSKLKNGGWSIKSNKLSAYDAGVEAWIETYLLKGKTKAAASIVDEAIKLFRFQ